MSLAFGLLLALAFPAITAAANPGDVGFDGPASDVGGAPSGSKPESKLWFNDGSWWGSLRDASTADFYIWRLDRTTHAWIRTGTALDNRNGTRADVLWDGTKLFVASHQFSESDGAGTSRLYRYSYNTGTDTYTLDGGFPATINSVKSETLTIAKDSTGQLWATWEQGLQIWVNRTLGSDAVWGTPFVLPAALNVNKDDISTIIAFGGDKIGVMWSNQAQARDYFAVHSDSQADTVWATPEVALSGSGIADDHLNLKTDPSGKVYAVVKTSLSGSNPLIKFLVRATAGAWTNYNVGTGSDSHTRPILVVDEAHSLFRIYMTRGQSGGPIVEKTSSMASISFPTGAGTTVMFDSTPTENKINNVSGTKQNVTSQTGLIVVAFNDTTRVYWHADIFGGSSANTAPTAAATSKTTAQDTAATVGLSGGDAETCQLTFAIVSPPTNGSLGSITDAACAAGSPNSDTATVVYTPTAGTFGPDSFTYTVSDGTLTSAPATASLTVTQAAANTTLTFTPIADSQVNSGNLNGNYGSLTTMKIREDAVLTNPTYRGYLKFSLSGVTGSVSSVKLRLFVTDASPNLESVFVVADNSWTETGITWTSAPSLTGLTAVGSSSAPTIGAYVEITLAPTTVSSATTTLSLAIKSSGTDSAIFSTRESATNKPQLAVTFQ